MSAQVARMRLGGKIEADDQDVQRTALLRRVAVAGAMIAMLIGGLALFDASRKPVEPPPVVSVTPAPAPAAEPEPPAEETALPTLPPADEAAVEAAPVSLDDTPPPLPESTARPQAPSAEQAPASAAPPARAPAARPTAREPATTAQTPARANAATPLTRTPAPEQGVIQGYRVQVGVFSNVSNAEDVRARLAASGIPSQLEVRVHVGPFKTRAEADRARAQLRKLGLDSAPPAAVRAAATRP
jgi:cell division protein FtsN